MNELVITGKLTKDPSREKHWVGAMLIQKLVTALLRDSLIGGTLNWDVAMCKALAIVLIAALACRTGDVTKAKLDTQLLPYLCYNDVTMKLVNGSDITSIEAQFVIWNEKVHK